MFKCLCVLITGRTYETERVYYARKAIVESTIVYISYGYCASVILNTVCTRVLVQFQCQAFKRYSYDSFVNNFCDGSQW